MVKRPTEADERNNQGFTDTEANEFLQTELIPELKREIFNAKDSERANLNEYFKLDINPQFGID